MNMSVTTSSGVSPGRDWWSVAPGEGHRTRVAATLACVAALVMAVAVPAAAAPPVVYDEGTFDDTYIVPAEAFPCGVDVTFREVGSYRFTAFFDNDGNVVLEQGHIGGTTTVTSVHGQIVNRWRVNGRIDPDAGTISVSGNSYNIHGGAGGILVNTSGHWVEDAASGELVFVAGPHEDGESNIEGVCAVLAPQG